MNAQALLAAPGPAVIGVGNMLLGDDGAGVRVVQELRRLAERDPASLPAGTRLVDAGTLGLDAAAAAAGADPVVLVDAVDLGMPAGTVSVFRGPALEEILGSPDGADRIGQLVGIGRLAGWLPGSLALVGIQVATVAPATRLSACVEGAIGEGVMTVCRLLSVGEPPEVRDAAQATDQPVHGRARA